MGKLADKLRELARGGGQPIGFAGMAARTQTPRMLVGTHLDAPDQQAVEDAVQSGADVILFQAGPATTDDMFKTFGTAGQRAMWGGILAMGGRDEVERLSKAKSDFVVLGSGTINADALLAENIDKVLEIDASWDDMLLRTVDQLPITAVLYRALGAEDLTVQHLMQCQKIIALARKPAFVLLPPAVGVRSLTLLRDAGVYGVVVPPGAVKDFRMAVHELPAPKRREERMEATLPAPGHGHEHDEDEDDD